MPETTAAKKTATKKKTKTTTCVFMHQVYGNPDECNQSTEAFKNLLKQGYRIIAECPITESQIFPGTQIAHVYTKYINYVLEKEA